MGAADRSPWPLAEPYPHFKQPAAHRHSFAISPLLLREFCPERAALRDQRAQGMPGARCARSLVCSVESTRV